MRDFFNRDCMEGMKEYPDKFFDLAIVDPPYGIGESLNVRGGTHHGKAHAPSKNYGKKQWDLAPPDITYFLELNRISKNQIIWGANHFLGLKSPGWIVWDKLTGENGYADCELAYSSFNKAVRKFVYQWKGYLQGNGKNKEIRIHPTQKPIALYRWLLKNYAKPGDLILDTHVGSASSLIACEMEGFDYVGFEIDKDYYEAAQKRIKQFRQQPTLWEQHKGQEARPNGAGKQKTLW